MPTSYSIVLIAAAIGVLPAFGWLLLIAKKDGLISGNLNFLTKIFFWGTIVAIPVSFFEIYVIESSVGDDLFLGMQKIWFHKQIFFVFASIFPVLLIALIEEFAKGIGIALSLFRNKINTLNDGMICGVIVGLAFAVTENGVYFAAVLQSAEGINLLGIVLLRFLISTSAHIVYSGLMGMFLVLAKMASNFTGKVGYTMLGFLVSVVVHFAFNFFLGPEYVWAIITAIFLFFVLMWIIYWLSEKKKGIRIL